MHHWLLFSNQYSYNVGSTSGSSPVRIPHHVSFLYMWNSTTWLLMLTSQLRWLISQGNLEIMVWCNIVSLNLSTSLSQFVEDSMLCLIVFFEPLNCSYWVLCNLFVVVVKLNMMLLTWYCWHAAITSIPLFSCLYYINPSLNSCPPLPTWVLCDDVV